MRLRATLLAMVCIAGFAIKANAQEKHLTFNAVAANVDGLPNTVAGQNVNPDGKEDHGAETMGRLFSKENWSIIAISEDFNYHSIMTDEAGTMFMWGTHGGSVEVTLENLLNGFRCSTDGLGILLARSNYARLQNETRVAWNDNDGPVLGASGDHGYDELITKGFRYYTVTLAAGFVVDVYVLHMDAGDRSNGADRNARTSQLQQLATYIKDHNNNRPILIMGDTNCRYTRDTLEEDLINSINNAGNGMTIKDAWVEVVRSGEYPEPNSDALMVHTLGPRVGEVVDKIFYINIDGAPCQIKPNTYEHAKVYNYFTDHDPIIVNFTITNSEGTDTPLEEKWTTEIPVLTETPVVGCEPESGKTYYFMNVETKQYLKAGGTWGAHADEGSAGTPITITASGGKYKLGTFENRAQLWWGGDGVHDMFMDVVGENYAWEFKLVDDTYKYYNIVYPDGALTSAPDQVYCRTLEASNRRQQWLLLDEAKMKEEMKKSTTSFNCTPLIPTADFDRGDFWVPNEAGSLFREKWTGAEGCSSGEAVWHWDALITNYCVGYTGNAARTLSYTLENMPAGTYQFTYEAFYRYRTGGTDKTLDATMTFNGVSEKLVQNAQTNIADYAQAARDFRDADISKRTITSAITSDQNMTISVYKPSVGSGAESWIAIDNFQLVYIGGDPTLEPRQKVARKINETWDKVAQLDEAGQNAYDISVILWRLSKQGGNYAQNDQAADVLCTLIDEAYATAVIASNIAKVEEAVSNGGGDITGVIVNPSFEIGDFTGWTYNQVGETVVSNEERFTTSNKDGQYLFNTWTGAATASYVKQTIAGLANGLYKLEAKVTSDAGKTIFLIGNNAHEGTKAEDNGVFKEASMYFLVDEGQATIGAIGSTPIDDDFSYYMPQQGWYFKADDFRLTYVCDMAHGRLKLALDKAENATLDEYGAAALNISNYTAMYEAKSLTSDGKAEAQAVHDALTAAVKAQKTKNADMTFAIVNPSFETGDWSGWNVTEKWETKASNNTDWLRVGYEGNHLFNNFSYDPDANAAKDDVIPISQTISGLPNGKYLLTARMTSDTGNQLFVAGNGTSGTALVAEDAVMRNATAEFEVTDGKATIMAGGAGANGTLDATNGGKWYKADDFRLTYLGREITLEETATTVPESGFYTKVTLNRPIPAGKWSTFVIPFETAVPEGLVAWKFTGAQKNGGYVDLSFTQETATLEAHVPYMVQPTGGEAVNIPAVENVELVMSAQPDEWNLNDAIVHGTYVYKNVPQGTYFINSNKYYYAEDTSNRIKGYRLYIDTTPAGAEAKGVRCVFGNFGDGTTGIDGVVDAEAAKVVAVFSVDGRRLDAPQSGINIVKMSDGTTKKVFVK